MTAKVIPLVDRRARGRDLIPSPANTPFHPRLEPPDGKEIDMPITNLQEALSMPDSQRATLPLIDVEHGTKLVLVALPKAVQIAPHKAPYAASVQLLTGRIEVLKGETWIPMAPGERVVFDKDQPHALKAFESSYLLVTHMRG